MLRPSRFASFAPWRETNPELVRGAHPTKSFVTFVFSFVVQSLHRLLSQNAFLS